MLRLPLSELDARTIGSWLVIGYAVAFNLWFFMYLGYATITSRGPIANAVRLFLAHTLIGVMTVPFILSAGGELGWVLSFSLLLIDIVIASFFEAIFDLPLAWGVAAYFLLGGGVYLILGFLLGLIAWAVRRVFGITAVPRLWR
ncbi:MAG: hypothetical protein K1X71_13830 [Pirellulales bacterium]|nr:hypothetical protein [Pirellulales bacterium]